MDHEPRSGFKKWLSNLQVADVFGYLVGLAGVAATVYSVVKSPTLAIVSITISQILMIVGWSLHIRNKYRNCIVISEKEHEIETLKGSMSEKETDYERKCAQLENDKQRMIKHLYTISNAVKSNNIHSNDILVKIPSDANEQYALLDKIRDITEKAELTDEARKKLQEEAQKSAEKYASQVFEVFNRYCRDSTDEVLNLQNAYLELKEIPLQVSSTIKLLDKPFHPGEDNIDEIKVYTAFRDNAAYNAQVREIGEIPYTIRGNTAFNKCMQSDYFYGTNLTDHEDSYSNEHKHYDEFYNCTIVVPIKLKRADGKVKFFGFLCCDCLNKDPKITEVFDRSAAQYLFAFAMNLATFMETLDANWIDRYKGLDGVPKDILEMLYGKIFKQGK